MYTHKKTNQKAKLYPINNGRWQIFYEDGSATKTISAWTKKRWWKEIEKISVINDETEILLLCCEMRDSTRIGYLYTHLQIGDNLHLIMEDYETGVRCSNLFNQDRQNILPDEHPKRIRSTNFRTIYRFLGNKVVEQKIKRLRRQLKKKYFLW